MRCCKEQQLIIHDVVQSTIQMKDVNDSLSLSINSYSNQIKDLIPKLITRIEYNKIISSSSFDIDSKLEKLNDCEKQTITFLKELELFVNIH